MSAPLDRLIPIGELAALLGFSCVATFRRHRKELAARGFPEPLIGQCYDPLAVKAWRLAQMDPKLRAALEAAPGAANNSIDWEAELAANANQLAAAAE